MTVVRGLRHIILCNGLELYFHGKNMTNADADSKTLSKLSAVRLHSSNASLYGQNAGLIVLEKHR